MVYLLFPHIEWPHLVCGAARPSICVLTTRCATAFWRGMTPIVGGLEALRAADQMSSRVRGI